MFTLTSAKLTGSPGESGWSQVHEFIPQEEEKLAKRGHFFAVVATGRFKEGIDSVVAGREILSRLHEEYFGNTDSSAYLALRIAVEKVIAEFGQSQGEIEIAASSLVGEVVYSAAGGGAQISIFREGALVTILSSGTREVVCASGYPQAGDILILGSRSFFSNLPQGVIKAALAEKDVASSMESLAPKIHSQENSGNIGVVLVGFGLETRPTLGHKDIYVKNFPQGESEKSRKTTLSAAFILLLLLAVSIVFGLRQKANRNFRVKYEPQILKAQHNLDEAKQLVAINPTRARELYHEAETILTSLQQKKLKDARIKGLAEDLTLTRGEVLGEYRADPEEFLDLTLQISGFEGKDLASSGEEIFILDPQGKKIIRVNLASKNTKVVVGPDKLESPQDMAAYEDRVFVLENEGVYEIDKDREKVVEKDWDGNALIYAYAANLYLVDKNNNKIIRFPAGKDGFAPGQDWLSASTKAEFEQISSMAVDGSIWLISGKTKLLRFSLGVPQSFSFKEAPLEITNLDQVYTNESLKYLYLLDKAGKRILVFDKEGVFKAQYLSDLISRAEDLVISEKEKKIVFLVGGKLYSIELKHLD